MIQELLVREEGKTLEFKENANSLTGIVKTVVAFANTAGGTIVIGIEDKTKTVVGLEDPLQDETRIIDKIAESVTPFLRPNIEIQSYRKKALILIHVPYATGPYYFKKDHDKLVYVRFGSTNRIADTETIATIKGLAGNMTFDEHPCPRAADDGLDWKGIEKSFSAVNKEVTKNKALSLGLLTTVAGAEHPSYGGILLFGKDRARIFPDAMIRCVRFSGILRGNTLAHKDIHDYLPEAIDAILEFINTYTFVETKIGKKRRESFPQYPQVAIREAVINSIVHADYSIKGSSIIIAIFDDRIEITNPGSVPYGLSLEEAIAGSSRARNRVIAKTFHALALVEQWGSGLQKIIQACINGGFRMPLFEDMNSQFRVTLYSEIVQKVTVHDWQKRFLEHLYSRGELSTHEAAKFWDVDIRSARKRLKKLLDECLVSKIGISKNDPYSKYILRKDVVLPS